MSGLDVQSAHESALYQGYRAAADTSSLLQFGVMVLEVLLFLLDCRKMSPKPLIILFQFTMLLLCCSAALSFLSYSR
jgi:hypothetical protein